MARILVVEDNPDNMKLFRALLAMKGHVVTGLWSGDGLLEELSANPPDLVLMDIQLPGRDGFELLTEIRRSPFSKLKVVALTAHAMSGDREKAENAGFDEYITKPIDISSFADQVARTLATNPDQQRGGR
jgi:CheY-like chemotaxis protein